MAYNITKSDGSQLVVVSDGLKDDTSTSLTLIGKNYSGYGEFLNENLVHILENFAKSTEPRSPLTGQLWWDSGSGALKVKAQSPFGWKQLSSSTPAAAAPSPAISGDMWWDTANNQLKIYNGTAWTLIGPAYSQVAGTSGAIVETIADSDSKNHIIVKLYTAGKVVATISQDAAFIPMNPFNGFTSIKPGITLASTSSVAGARFFGIAEDSDKLGSVEAIKYARTDIPVTFANTVSVLADGGLTLGSSGKFTQTVSSNTAEITNRTLNSNIVLAVNVGGTITTLLRADGSTSTVRISNLVATTSSTLSGNTSIAGNTTISSTTVITGATSISGATAISGSATFSGTTSMTSTTNLSGPTNISGTTTISGSTTVATTLVPDSTSTRNLGSSTLKFGNIYANYLIGTSIQAQYADLAERFESDASYPAGTVVAIGGAKEITAAIEELSEEVFGVVSTKAAYLMNAAAGSDETHPAIAVNGRVPVRVIGRINKGDRLVAAGNGLARAGVRSELTSFNVIGRALETKTTDGEGTILAIVKLNS